MIVGNDWPASFALVPLLAEDVRFRISLDFSLNMSFSSRTGVITSVVYAIYGFSVVGLLQCLIIHSTISVFTCSEWTVVALYCYACVCVSGGSGVHIWGAVGWP